MIQVASTTERNVTPQHEARELAEKLIAETIVSRCPALKLDPFPDDPIKHGNFTVYGNKLFRELTIVPEQIADLPWLEVLSIQHTKVENLNFLKGLKNLRALYLSNTSISNIDDSSHLKYLEEIRLDGTRVYDLSPLKNALLLREIFLEGTPIILNDKRVESIYSTTDGAKFIEKLSSIDSNTDVNSDRLSDIDELSNIPDQDEDLRVYRNGRKFEIGRFRIDPNFDEDPILQSLHEQLIFFNNSTQRLAGNRHYSLSEKCRRLQDSIEKPFEKIDPVETWLIVEQIKMEYLRDNKKREEPFDSELIETLSLTIDIGGALLLGTRAVQVFQTRSEQFRTGSIQIPRKSTKRLAKAITQRDDIFGKRIVDYLSVTVNEDSDIPSVEITRYRIVRNVLIAAAGFIITSALSGTIGNTAHALAEMLVANIDAVFRFAGEMGQATGDWLVRLIVRIKELLANPPASQPAPIPKPPYG
ncbi:MAG: leucine-rich repeat domain-containing protein [Pseudomonadota bacterium]